MASLPKEPQLHKYSFKGDEWSKAVEESIMVEGFHKPQKKWPDIIFIPSIDITDAEFTKKPKHSTQMLVTSQSCKDPLLLDNTIDCTKYSKWNKVLFGTAYVLKFVSAFHKSSAWRSQHTTMTTCNNANHLTVEEINNSDMMWMLHLQCKSL